MKILIFTNHFYPENFKANDIAFDLAEKGHKVTVCTAIPDYPQGNFHKGYGFFKKRREIVNGVKVIRIPLIPRGKGGGLRLMLNYISFLFFSVFYALGIALFSKFDKVFVHHTSPVTVGVPAVIVKKIQNIPLVFWNLDLWPESLIAAGGIRNKSIIAGVEKLVQFIYNNSDKILISSEGFRESILAKGNYQNKIEYFPNWAEEIFENNKLLAAEQLPNLPKGFKIMYAGNVGEAQNLEMLMQAALKLREQSQIKWIIVGDGRKLPYLKDFVKENKLEETVYLLGRFPFEYMPSFYDKADAMFLSLKDDEIFRLTVPARLQSYMACQKPILAMINGEAARIINKSDSGFVSKAEDVETFVEQVMEMSKLSASELKNLGKNSKAYYHKYFLRSHKLNQIEKILANA